MRVAWVVVAGLLAATVARPAGATSELLFGFGPRDVALAQSDVADASAVAAAWVNPAFVWRPGVRVLVGYGHGGTALKLDGEDAGVRDIAGTEFGLQLGGEIGDDVALGGGLTLHLPNRSLARISFAPGTEPSFVRFDPASQRTTFDAALALRLGWLSLGFGASVLVSAEGQVDFLLGQDANGTFADGEADVSLPYDVAPVFGMAADFGPAGLAFRYRGAQAIDVDLTTTAVVDVQGNPLNGVTEVGIAGASGYVPATADVAARWSPISWVRVMTSLQLARWSAAPGSAADLSMDVDLGLSPGQREGRFVRPGYRDTISPRVGLELWPLADRGPWVLRAGYAFTPSPVPQSQGFASPVDASTHSLAAGAGVGFGRVWGVELRGDVALLWMLLKRRAFDKGQDTLPFARYEASGFIGLASAALEGSWR